MLINLKLINLNTSPRSLFLHFEKIDETLICECRTKIKVVETPTSQTKTESLTMEVQFTNIYLKIGAICMPLNCPKLRKLSAEMMQLAKTTLLVEILVAIAQPAEKKN